MGKMQDDGSERAPIVRSVDLHNKGVPLDEYLRDHGDIATSDGESCMTVNPGRDEAQEMLAALADIAERSPRAVVVLLLSVVRGKSKTETARIMHTQARHVSYVRAWLRRHYPKLAMCCHRS